MDKIVAKYQQEDSGEFEAVGTPAFNAKSTKLASLFACMSQLCLACNYPCSFTSPRKLKQSCLLRLVSC